MASPLSISNGVYLFFSQLLIDFFGISPDDGINDDPDYQIANDENAGKH